MNDDRVVYCASLTHTVTVIIHKALIQIMIASQDNGIQKQCSL